MQRLQKAQFSKHLNIIKHINDLEGAKFLLDCRLHTGLWSGQGTNTSLYLDISVVSNCEYFAWKLGLLSRSYLYLTLVCSTSYSIFHAWAMSFGFTREWQAQIITLYHKASKLNSIITSRSYADSIKIVRYNGTNSSMWVQWKDLAWQGFGPTNLLSQF